MSVVYAFVVAFTLQGEPQQWRGYVPSCVQAFQIFKATNPTAEVNAITCIKIHTVNSNTKV